MSSLAIGEGNVDLFGGHLDLGRVAVDGGARGPLQQLVGEPVVAVGVGEEDLDHPQTGRCFQDSLALGGHVHDGRLAGGGVDDDVGVVVERAQRPDFDQTEGALVVRLQARFFLTGRQTVAL